MYFFIYMFLLFFMCYLVIASFKCNSISAKFELRSNASHAATKQKRMSAFIDRRAMKSLWQNYCNKFYYCNKNGKVKLKIKRNANQENYIANLTCFS